MMDARLKHSGMTLVLLFLFSTISFAQPEIKERLAVLGFKGVANTPEEFAARIRVEIAKWGKVVHDANLRIE